MTLDWFLVLLGLVLLLLVMVCRDIFGDRVHRAWLYVAVLHLAAARIADSY